MTITFVSIAGSTSSLLLDVFDDFLSFDFFTGADA